MLDALDRRMIWYKNMSGAGEGFPDIMTSTSHVAFIEIKSPGRPVKIKQLEFMISFPGVAGFATTPAEAIAIATQGRPLTNLQRFALQKSVDEMKGKGQKGISINIVMEKLRGSK